MNSQIGGLNDPAQNNIIRVLRDLGQDLAAFTDGFDRNVSVTPGRSYSGKTKDGGISLEVKFDFGSGGADVDHRLAPLQGRPGRRLRLWHGRHPLPSGGRQHVAQVRDVEPGASPQRPRVQRQARLAGRRLLRRRRPDAEGHASVRRRSMAGSQPAASSPAARSRRLLQPGSGGMPCGPAGAHSVQPAR